MVLINKPSSSKVIELLKLSSKLKPLTASIKSIADGGFYFLALALNLVLSNLGGVLSGKLNAMLFK